jgi:hypothetical protein
LWTYNSASRLTARYYADFNQFPYQEGNSLNAGGQNGPTADIAAQFGDTLVDPVKRRRNTRRNIAHSIHTIYAAGRGTRP